MTFQNIKFINILILVNSYINNYKNKFLNLIFKKKDLNELIDMFPLIAKEGIKQILLASGGIKENVERKLLNIFPKND